MVRDGASVKYTWIFLKGYMRYAEGDKVGWKTFIVNSSVLFEY